MDGFLLLEKGEISEAFDGVESLPVNSNEAQNFSELFYILVYVAQNELDLSELPQIKIEDLEGIRETKNLECDTAQHAGTGEEQGVQEEIDFYFATFAKAMASIGAFIASKNHVIKYLYYNTRSQIFAKALPIIITLGAMKRLELIKKGALLREQMWANARNLQESLRLHELISGMNETPITAVYMKGELDESLRVLIDIRDQFNVFCSGVIYPVVPKGIFLFRLVATAKHTKLDIEETIHAFSNVSTKLNAGFYKQV